MNSTSIVQVLFFTAVVVYILYRVLSERKKIEVIGSVTSLSRGERSERDLIYQLVKAGIPASTIFHDLYLPSKHGHTQIDLVVPTNVGIFVFEVKDYSGWLFGDARQDRWTQVLAYGEEKHQFYNPIKQNATHIEAIQNSSEQLQNIPMYSILVFYGSCELKNITNVPQNCWLAYSSEVEFVVKSIMANAQPAPYTDKWEVMRILRSAVENGKDESIKAAHLQKVQRTNMGKYRSTYGYSYVSRFLRYHRSRFKY